MRPGAQGIGLGWHCLRLVAERSHRTRPAFLHAPHNVAPRWYGIFESEALFAPCVTWVPLLTLLACPFQFLCLLRPIIAAWSLRSVCCR